MHLFTNDRINSWRNRVAHVVCEKCLLSRPDAISKQSAPCVFEREWRGQTKKVSASERNLRVQGINEANAIPPKPICDTQKGVRLRY